MENTKIINVRSNYAFRDAICQKAFDGKAINTRDVDSESLKKWKKHVNTMRDTLISYGNGLQNNSALIIQESTTAFYDALTVCKQFAGFTFPNTIAHGKYTDELNIWFARLTRVQNIKDNDGKIIDSPLTVCSSETMRKQIELIFAMRETGKIGMTMKEYEEYKAYKKELKKIARQEKEKEKAKITGVDKMSPDCYKNAIA